MVDEKPIPVSVIVQIQGSLNNNYINWLE